MKYYILFWETFKVQKMSASIEQILLTQRKRQERVNKIVNSMNIGNLVDNPSLELNPYKRISRHISSGTYSKVYKCVKNHRMCSVKNRPDQVLIMKRIVLSEITEHATMSLIRSEPSMLEPFKKSKRIVNVVDSYIYRGMFYIIFRNVACTDLCNYITMEKFNYPIKHERLVRQIFREMVLAVKECHSFGIVHRDIKLENFLLMELPEIKKFGALGKIHIRLSDFGFAKYSDINQVFTESLGTTFYLAPELDAGEGYSGYKVDVWALGVCLYILYTGEYPFPGVQGDDVTVSRDIQLSPPRNIKKLPCKLEGIVSQILEKDPSKRLSIDEILSSEWMNLMN